jgi:hypothetical protein
VEGYALDSAAVNTAYYVTNERINPHQFVNEEMKAALMLTYKHPILEVGRNGEENTPIAPWIISWITGLFIVCKKGTRWICMSTILQNGLAWFRFLNCR